MSLVPPQAVTVPVSVGADTITVGIPGADTPVVVSTTTGPATLTINVPAGTVSSPTGTSGAGGIPDNEVTALGPVGELGTLLAEVETTTGHRVWGHGVPTMAFEPGYGPFFSQVLPDGTVAMPQMQLSISQATNTGLTLAMSFWSPRENVFYTVKVPTTTGYTEVPIPTDVVGGADMSDCALVTFDTVFGPEPILFGLSAIPYRGWTTTTYGEWPVLPAFKLDVNTGRWVYRSERSIFPATLRASDPLYGAQAWPNQDNIYAQSVTRTLLPCELVTLPQSGHLAIAVYAPRTGRLTGSVVVVDADAKEQVGYYEFPDFTTPAGSPLRALPRDINADPTSDVDDERILLNFDTFGQPNETWNAVVKATSGFWRVSWGGVFTSSLAVGAEASTVQAALEAIPAIGAGNVAVRASRPFLLTSFTVYEIEMIGARAHTDLSATAIALDASSLVGDDGSLIRRWRTGGTGYTDKRWFPLVELTYNATDGTLEPLTAPMIPHDTLDNARPELVDASFGVGWYGQDGTAWAHVSGISHNPDLDTSFLFRGLHAWRKDPATGERRYVTDCPATGAWDDNVGSARPVPDAATNGLHRGGGHFALAMAEDHHTGAVLAITTAGRLKIAVPTPALEPRSGNLLDDSAPTDWTAQGSHTGVWDATENAFKITATSTAEAADALSPAGTSGIPVPESLIGELLQLEVDVRAGTTGRVVYPVVRFYDAAGAEIEALSGWGPATRITTSSDYRTIVGSVHVPEGCRYLSAGVSVRGPANTEIQYVRRAELFVPGVTVVPDVDTGAHRLFDGSGHGSWVAKGVVDPKTRHLWIPFIQSMTELQARLTRFPGWLMRVDMGQILAGVDAA